MIPLDIAGMRCQHCVKAVGEALSQVPGVDRRVEVNLERGEARVNGDADFNALSAAVAEQGYEAKAA